MRPGTRHVQAIYRPDVNDPARMNAYAVLQLLRENAPAWDIPQPAKSVTRLSRGLALSETVGFTAYLFKSQRINTLLQS
jgi:hypothetical protein